MYLDRIRDWFVANQVGLLIGALVAGAIIAGLLLFRALGRRACERDP
jgi:hypothetical protein